MIKRLSKELLRELAKAPQKTARAWFDKLTPEEKKEAERLLAALNLKLNI